MNTFKGSLVDFTEKWMHCIKNNKPSLIQRANEFKAYNISDEDLKKELEFRNNFYNKLKQ